MHTKVDDLRNKLIKDYPVLSNLNEKPKKLLIKPIPIEKNVVRPSITSYEIANMLQQSAHLKNIKDFDYGPLPKKQIPFKLKVQEYEAETSLNCFMKHKATKSFEKYVTEKTPGFRKSNLTEIRLPERKIKPKKTKIFNNLNPDNLEIFGQIEVHNKTPKFQQNNLRMIEKDIKKKIKNWCIQEKNSLSVETQLIDRYTFKFKHK